MDKEIEDKIIELYLSGVGSTTIIKLIPNTTKRKILELLKTKNILRNNKLSDNFYDNFWEENNEWCGLWTCQHCKTEIKFCVNNKTLLNRNLKRKEICKKCSLKKQKGLNNPFFGKHHSIDSINKISKSKLGIKTSDHMSKPEYKLLFSNMAKERWSNGSMEEVRIKMSNLMKERISLGLLSGFNRSKAEYEIIEILEKENITVIPNYKIESKIFDIYIPKFNLLIEYNGDYWHCNPIKYKHDYLNVKKNMTAKEIWEYDKDKIYLAEINNYNCEIIWETDYKKNKNIILEIIRKYDKK